MPWVSHVSVRSFSDKLFLDVSVNFRGELVALTQFDETKGACPPESLFRKVGSSRAIGHGKNHKSGSVPFVRQ